MDAVDKDNSFDEHKCIVGALSEDEARRIYLANYQAGWRCGKITALTMTQFKDWLIHGNKTKPVAPVSKSVFSGVLLVLVKAMDKNDKSTVGIDFDTPSTSTALAPRRTAVAAKPPKVTAVAAPLVSPHANHVFHDMRDGNGKRLSLLKAPYDGTEEGARAVAEHLHSQAEEIAENRASMRGTGNYADDYSRVSSRTGSTDEIGQAKWAISPNLRHVAKIGTRDARYIFGDLTAAPGKMKNVTPAAPFQKSIPNGTIWALIKSVVDKKSLPTGVPHSTSPNLEPAQTLSSGGYKSLEPNEHAAYKKVVDKLHPFIRIPGHILPHVLNEGRFKSQFETGTSGGLLDHSARKNAEKTQFGVAEDAPHEHRPIYGYLHQNVNGIGSGDDAFSGADAAHYGDVVVRLKNHMKDRTTFTHQDSMGAHPKDGNAPSHLHEPHAASLPYDTLATRSFSKGRRAISPFGYTEAQYWGGVKKEDIDHVIIPHNHLMSPDKLANLHATLHAHGIPFRHGVTADSKFKDGLHLPTTPPVAA